MHKRKIVIHSIDYYKVPRLQDKSPQIRERYTWNLMLTFEIVTFYPPLFIFCNLQFRKLWGQTQESNAPLSPFKRKSLKHKSQKSQSSIPIYFLNLNAIDWCALRALQRRRRSLNLLYLINTRLRSAFFAFRESERGDSREIWPKGLAMAVLTSVNYFRFERERFLVCTFREICDSFRNWWSIGLGLKENFKNSANMVLKTFCRLAKVS